MSTSGINARTVIWVSGSSSGIGAAFVDTNPLAGSRVIGIARRPHPRVENLCLDLADPAAWTAVADSFEAALSTGRYGRAVFFHAAGTVAGDGPLIDTDAVAYTNAVLLNSAAGQILGRAFLTAAARAAVPVTLVMCSSPAATDALPGLSHYCAGKAALSQWTRAVGTELSEESRVFSVIPHAVDTPMVRGLMEKQSAELPIGGFFRQAAHAGQLASPQDVARAIWSGIVDGVPQGDALVVGASHLAETGP